MKKNGICFVNGKMVQVCNTGIATLIFILDMIFILDRFNTINYTVFTVKKVNVLQVLKCGGPESVSL